jgi:hypothetical protein
VDPKSAVSVPATLLMVVGGINLLFGIAVVLSALTGIGSSFIGGNWLHGALGIVYAFVWACVNLGIAGLIAYGAMQMQQLRNYNLALISAVAACLPCSHCCCFIGLAAGIWSIIILMKPEVKAAFTNT